MNYGSRSTPWWCSAYPRRWRSMLVAASMAGTVLVTPTAVQATTGAPAGARVDAANDEQKKAATEAFLRGTTAAEAGSHAEAAAAFRASLAAVDSPNTRLLLARSLIAQGRLAEAHAELAEAEVEARRLGASIEKYQKTAEATAKERDELRQKLGSLTITGTGDNAVMIGDRQVSSSESKQPILVDPGEVNVSVGEGADKRSKIVTVGAGDSTVVDLSPPAAKEPEPAVAASTDDFDKRTWAYVAGGVGAAGMLGFVVFGSLNNSKFDELQKGCTDFRCPDNLRDASDSGQRYQTFANVSLALGVIGLGVGTYLYLTSKPKAEGPPTGMARLRLGPGNVALQGRF